jgi:alkylhydroperoxidase/carboxymuconolactone decarboxylase family protein YurZ
MEPSDRQKLKEEFVARRGYWSEAWDLVLELDAEYFRSYMELSAGRNPKALDPKVRELVLLAVDITATHLYRPGARIHIKRALELGATTAELMEIFELASLIGVHAVVEGALLLRACLSETEAIEGSKGSQ